MLAGFTDSRTFRDAFPECAAYGFFPHRVRTRFETDPLIHSADERIDVRDLEFATALLPRRLRAPARARLSAGLPDRVAAVAALTWRRRTRR